MLGAEDREIMLNKKDLLRRSKLHRIIESEKPLKFLIILVEKFILK